MNQNIPKTETLLKAIPGGDTTALSRAITLVESARADHREQARELITACLPHADKSVRIGITGVPGVGKSTFIESFGKLLLEEGKKVAVLAIDPSSTVSSGSILGDKTRMETLARSPGAFIRPSPSSASLGGVARKTRETIILCEAAGFDVVIVETVGVGQSETAVHSMTDFFLLLALAGAGDELQGIKRGIVEMADAVVINKADGNNLKAAKRAKADMARALHLFPARESGWMPQTALCSALHDEGVAEVWQLIHDYLEHVCMNRFFEKRRRAQNRYWLRQAIEEQLLSGFFGLPDIQSELKRQEQAIDKGETTPFEAAEILLNINKTGK